MSRLLLVLLVAAAAGAAAAPALASERRPTLAELEREVICPTCQTLLAFSQAPIAQRMRRHIAERIAAGDTKSEIKARLVAEFGEGVLAAPPRRGFNLLAWVLPIAGAALGVVALAVVARRWRGSRETLGAPEAAGRTPALDPELERRVDEELARFEA